jgi:5-carboxymethyl-2-hydroxymuconate isomerase
MKRKKEEEMPHLVIECSDNIPRELFTRELLRELHQALERTGVVKLGDIKGRFFFAPVSLIGDGTESDAFVHCRLALLPGRTPEKKREMSDGIYQVLRHALAAGGGAGFRRCALSVELIELEGESYSKGSIEA